MTTLILRPAPKPRRANRFAVVWLTDEGEERYLGSIEENIGQWRSSMHAWPCKTRDDAARKLAETFLVPGPYHIEELARRRKVVKRVRLGCGRWTSVVTVRMERVS